MSSPRPEEFSMSSPRPEEFSRPRLSCLFLFFRVLSPQSFPVALVSSRAEAEAVFPPPPAEDDDRCSESASTTFPEFPDEPKKRGR